MNEQELFSKKQRGDLSLVAKLTGLSLDYVTKIMKRPRAKRRVLVLETMEKVIKAREDLLSNKSPTENGVEGYREIISPDGIENNIGELTPLMDSI